MNSDIGLFCLLMLGISLQKQFAFDIPKVEYKSIFLLDCPPLVFRSILILHVSRSRINQYSQKIQLGKKWWGIMPLSCVFCCKLSHKPILHFFLLSTTNKMFSHTTRTPQDKTTEKPCEWYNNKQRWEKGF